MADQQQKRPFVRKGTTDFIIAVAALFVSAVSLWVGIRTEAANEQLVAASTWPFLQVSVSNAKPDQSLDLQFEVTNTGVGPAKIESFEVFWKGKPYRTAASLMHDCCGYIDYKATSPEAKKHTRLAIGTVQGVVLRAGEVETFIHYPLGPDNLAVWSKLDAARAQMTYRICYCSVLNECWRASLTSDLAVPGHLHPPEVGKCPTPPVAYVR